MTPSEQMDGCARLVGEELERWKERAIPRRNSDCASAAAFGHSDMHEYFAAHGIFTGHDTHFETSIYHDGVYTLSQARASMEQNDEC